MGFFQDWIDLFTKPPEKWKCPKCGVLSDYDEYIEIITERKLSHHHNPAHHYHCKKCNANFKSVESVRVE